MGDDHNHLLPAMRRLGHWTRLASTVPAYRRSMKDTLEWVCSQISDQHSHRDKTPEQPNSGADDAGSGQGDTSVWLDADGQIYSDLRARRYQNYVLGAYSLMIPPTSFDIQPDSDHGGGHGGMPGDG